MAVVECVSVSLEVTLGRMGVSQALRLGGQGVVPESPPAGPAFEECPIKGQNRAALAMPTSPPTMTTRMKMSRCGLEEAALSQMLR